MPHRLKDIRAEGASLAFLFFAHFFIFCSFAFSLINEAVSLDFTRETQRIRRSTAQANGMPRFRESMANISLGICLRSMPKQDLETTGTRAGEELGREHIFLG